MNSLNLTLHIQLSNTGLTESALIDRVYNILHNFEEPKQYNSAFEGNTCMVYECGKIYKKQKPTWNKMLAFHTSKDHNIIHEILKTK